MVPSAGGRVISVPLLSFVVSVKPLCATSFKAIRCSTFRFVVSAISCKVLFPVAWIFSKWTVPWGTRISVPLLRGVLGKNPSNFDRLAAIRAIRSVSSFSAITMGVSFCCVLYMSNFWPSSTWLPTGCAVSECCTVWSSAVTVSPRSFLTLVSSLGSIASGNSEWSWGAASITAATGQPKTVISNAALLHTLDICDITWLVTMCFWQIKPRDLASSSEYISLEFKVQQHILSKPAKLVTSLHAGGKNVTSWAICCETWAPAYAQE